MTARPNARFSPQARTLGTAAAPYAGLLLLGLLAYLFPHASPSGKTLSLATSAAVFAIAASALGFLWGQSGQLTVAHAAVFGLGAYAAAIGAKRYHLTFGESLPFSIVVGAIAGGVVALPSLRTTGHYFVILTFAVGEVIAVFETRLHSLTGGVDGITTLPGRQTFLGYKLAQRADFFSLVVIFGVIVLLVLCFIIHSRWGTILRGIRENPPLAASLGVPVAIHRVCVFVLAGAIAGLAGQLYLYQVKFIAPALFETQLSLYFLLMVLIGGRTYLLGPAIGGIVYFFLPEFIHLSPILSQIVFGVLLVIMILAAPNGLLSLGTTAKRLRQWRSRRGAATSGDLTELTAPGQVQDVSL